MLKLILRVGIFVAIVGVVYCVLGLIQLASYSAGPNYPKELATQHFNLWLLGMGLSIIVGVFCLVFLGKVKRKQHEGPVA
jgi:uncharacterized membrane protein